MLMILVSYPLDTRVKLGIIYNKPTELVDELDSSLQETIKNITLFSVFFFLTKKQREKHGASLIALVTLLHVLRAHLLCVAFIMIHLLLSIIILLGGGLLLNSEICNLMMNSQLPVFKVKLLQLRKWSIPEAVWLTSDRTKGQN